MSNQDDNAKMTLITQIMNATNEQLQKVAQALDGKTPQEEVTDKRLFTFTDFAKALNVSRCTVWRMVKAGKLRTVNTTGTRLRIPASELTRLHNTASVQAVTA